MVKLPRIKLETAPQAFYFAGGRNYNKLPLDIRKIDAILTFKKELKSFYS